MSEMARRLRAEYQRKKYHENIEESRKKSRERVARYWEKKAAEAAAVESDQETAEQEDK